MAATYSGDLKIYDTLIRDFSVEKLQANFQLFGNASANSIRFVANEFLGDFKKESFVLQPTVDVNDLKIHEDGDIVYNKIAQSEVVEAKFLRYVAESANLKAMREAGLDEAGWAARMGELFGERLTKQAVDLAIGAGIAAISETATNVIDKSTAAFDYGYLIDAMGVFGDQSNRIVAMVGHSGAYREMAKKAVGLSSLDSVGGVQIVRGDTATMGLPFIQYDSAALVQGTGVDAIYTVLFLTQNALVAMQTGPDNVRTDVDFTKQGDIIRAKHEIDWTLGLKGYTWTGVTGSSVAPIDDAALKSAANWAQISTDVKNTAGSVLKFKAS